MENLVLLIAHGNVERRMGGSFASLILHRSAMEFNLDSLIPIDSIAPLITTVSHAFNYLCQDGDSCSFEIRQSERVKLSAITDRNWEALHFVLEKC